MKKTLVFLFACIIAFAGFLVVRADEATTTEPVVDPVVDVATSTPDTDIATTTDVVSTSTPDTVADTTQVTPVTPVAPLPVVIHLEVDTQSTKLFDADAVVQPCVSVPGTPQSVSGYCALEQSGLGAVWSPYGDDMFLSSVGGVSNNYATNQYWSWFGNLEYGQTALNKHVLSAGEHLLVNIGRMPLKISVSGSQAVGATATVTVQEFGFDGSWNSVWLPSTATIHVGDGTYQPNAGSYLFVASTTDLLRIYASKPGFIDSESISFAPSGQNTQVSAVSTPPVVAATSTAVTKHFDIAAAMKFLTSQKTGAFSDWSVFALVAAGEGSGIAFDSTSNLTSVTDYERRAMARMAAGKSPYAPVSYIEKIVAAYDGNQIGDAGLINDDVFAIFPLVRAGYSVHDPMLATVVSHIISDQGLSGAWGDSVDMTAATVQALLLVQAEDGSNQILRDSVAKASDYLSREHDAGHIKNSFSLSWYMQAEQALGKSVGVDELTVFQDADGGLEASTTDMSTRIWATAYAIPAALGRTWADMMVRFDRPTTVSPQAHVISNSKYPSDARQQSASSASSSVIKAYFSPLEANVIGGSDFLAKNYIFMGLLLLAATVFAIYAVKRW